MDVSCSTDDRNCGECLTNCSKTKDPQSCKAKCADPHCTPCPEGSVAAASDNQCTSCRLGFFQPKPGQTECLSCDMLGNSYQDEPGKTFCKKCPQNTNREHGANFTSIFNCVCKTGFFVDQLAESLQGSTRPPGVPDDLNFRTWKCTACPRADGIVAICNGTSDGLGNKSTSPWYAARYFFSLNSARIALIAHTKTHLQAFYTLLYIIHYYAMYHVHCTSHTMQTSCYKRLPAPPYVPRNFWSLAEPELRTKIFKCPIADVCLGGSGLDGIPKCEVGYAGRLCMQVNLSNLSNWPKV